MEELMERPESRYIVGIDLGTTNCAVAFVDTTLTKPRVATFQVEQMVDWSSVEARDTLPSFHYQLTSQESTSVKNRWIAGTKNPFVVGMLARDRGLQMPGRQIASAKSWLCHPGIDRTAPILPWHGDEDVETFSPVEASAAYLRHIREAWDLKYKSFPLAEQDVVVTLPASFDEVARELTIEAAKLAGLPRIFLLEEPQAAFYAWLDRHGEDWSQFIKAGESVLVCDIGGGTTDLTLIRVKAGNEGAASSTIDSNAQRLHRVAVGQHLILGGDNLDLALAKAAEGKLLNDPKGQLAPRDWDALRLNCRVAKEVLLGEHPPESHVITLVGSGSRLLSQSKSVTIDRDLVKTTLLDGFFPMADLQDRPIQAASGFQEFGLPYAADPAVTKHLASFLWEHRNAGRDEEEVQKKSPLELARPDFILFNGGVLEASQIRERLLDQIGSWFASTTSDPDWKPRQLEGNRLDLAVAQGAAYFGLVRRGQGVRIDASLARSYYLCISEDPPQAMCLVPGDARPGDRFRLSEHPFELMLGQPVQFPLLVSSIQLADPAGTILPIDAQHMTPMPSIRTVLELPKSRRAEKARVIVEAELTEIGTLQLACALEDGSHRWKLDFDIRSAVETDRAAHEGQAEAAGIVDQSTIDAACDVLDRAFGKERSIEPNQVMKRLADATEISRSQWRPSLLRAMWSKLIELDEGRRISAVHEARWLNLLGYCLRPGYGFAADDWRVATTWRKVQGKLQFKSAANASEAIILWRRIAGGFTAGQQKALFQEIVPRLKGLLLPDVKGPSNLATNEAVELLRLAGSLELLSGSDRGQLGRWCVTGLKRKKLEPLYSAMLWVIGRVGARVPMYGPIHQLIPISQVESWIESIIDLPVSSSDLGFALLLLARRTGDRYRDLSDAARQRVLTWMEKNEVAEGTIQLVREVGELSDQQRSSMAGEALPLGLRLAAGG